MKAELRSIEEIIYYDSCLCGGVEACTCGGQKTALWGQLSPSASSIFMWVSGVKVRGFHSPGNHPYPCSLPLHCFHGVCVCTCVCRGGCAHLCTCLQRTEVGLDILTLAFLYLSFETRSFIDSAVHNLAKPWDLPVSVHLEPGLQAPADVSSFLDGCWGS